VIDGERLMTITRDDYLKARNALETLVRERARILPLGLEALREWLATGAGERWRQHEAVVQQARDEDLALGMIWEFEWRREKRRERKAEERARRKTEATPIAQCSSGTTGGNIEIAAPAVIGSPEGKQGPAVSQQRSFSPTGPVWRP